MKRNQIKAYSGKHQGGFTLVELLVVIAIIGVLAGLSLLSFNGDKSKATELFAKMDQYGSAMMRVKMDVGCFPLVTGVLVQQSLAVSGNSSCGVDMQANWRGPYVKGAPMDASGKNIQMNEIGDTAVLSVASGSNINGSGNTRQWYLEVSGVPTPVADQFMVLCNKGYVDKDKKFYKRGACVLGAANAVTVPTTDTGVQKVWMIFDERP